MTDEAWRRLAGLVRDRRIELGLSQAQLALDAGTTERTVRLIEKAERTSYRLATLRGIAQALDWTPDSIDRVLRGDEPVAPRPPGTASMAVDPRIQELAELIIDVEREQMIDRRLAELDAAIEVLAELAGPEVVERVSAAREAVRRRLRSESAAAATR